MGCLRVFLALIVIQFHGVAIIFPLPLDGRTAVMGFYVISGFYMALILNEKYANRPRFDFYPSRFLRIFPAYWIVTALIVLTITLTQTVTVLPSQTRPGLPVYEASLSAIWSQFSGFNLFQQLWLYLGNLWIVTGDMLFLTGFHGNETLWAPNNYSELHNGTQFYLNQVAFSLAMECYFYLAAPFLVKNQKRLWVCISIALLYHLVTALAGLEYVIWNYHLFPASFFYFLAGSLCYHYRPFLRRLRWKYCLSAFLFLWCVATFTGLQFSILTLPMAILLAATIPSLFDYSKNSRWDRVIGNLSYPLYLCHWPVKLYAPVILGTKPSGEILFLICVALAVLLYVLIDRPIEKYRY